MFKSSLLATNIRGENPQPCSAVANISTELGSNLNINLCFIVLSPNYPQSVHCQDVYSQGFAVLVLDKTTVMQIRNCFVKLNSLFSPNTMKPPECTSVGHTDITDCKVIVRLDSTQEFRVLCCLASWLVSNVSNSTQFNKIKEQ